MKNTARRVGAPEGVRGEGRAEPRESRSAVRREDGRGITRAPRETNDVWPMRAIGQGIAMENLGQPHRGETWRSPDRYAPRQPRKNSPAGATAVPSVARATQERAEWRGGRSRRRSPTRATRRSREKLRDARWALANVPTGDAGRGDRKAGI